MATGVRPRSTRVRRPPARRRPAERAPRIGLDAVAAAWWLALDAADAALQASASTLTEKELRSRSGRLAQERTSTVRLLEDVTRAEGVPARFSQLLVSRANLGRLLGLPSGVAACVFNADGVLIDSAALHAAAWAEAFDAFLLGRSDRLDGRFAPFDRFTPFDPARDYWRHLHGKPRLEGVRAFLASRGISLPEGRPDDAPGADTVHGLASRKRAALLRRLEKRGIDAYEGSRRYLELAHEAGLRCGVVSASANTDAILARTNLSTLVDARVDGAAMVAERLRAEPAPDVLLAASVQLGIEPANAAAFATSPAGVTAARTAGFRLVVGVNPHGGEALTAAGADLVVRGLAELLDRARVIAPP